MKSKQAVSHRSLEPKDTKLKCKARGQWSDLLNGANGGMNV